MAPFAAVTPRERIVGALRYYGFAIALVLIGLAIFTLTALEYSKSQRAAEAPTPDADIAQLQALASRVQNEAAATPEALGAAINVFTTPSGAMVSVDGVPQGYTPLIGHGVRPGRYRVTLSGAGFSPLDTLVDVTSGGSAFVSLDLDVDATLAGLAEPGGVIRVEPPPARPSAGPSRAAASSSQVEAPAVEPRATRPTPTRTGALAIVTEPPDARVLLDGSSAGVAPIVLSGVPVGEHEVVVHAPGYTAASRTVTVSEGRQETLRVTLGAQQGTLAVLVRPWGSIYVEGTLMKRDTDVLYTANLPTGFHTVRAVHPTLGERTQTVEIRPGATTRVDFQFDNN